MMSSFLSTIIITMWVMFMIIPEVVGNSIGGSVKRFLIGYEQALKQESDK